MTLKAKRVSSELLGFSVHEKMEKLGSDVSSNRLYALVNKE